LCLVLSMLDYFVLDKAYRYMTTGAKKWFIASAGVAITVALSIIVGYVMGRNAYTVVVDS